jgi:hypothetical protein
MLTVGIHVLAAAVLGWVLPRWPGLAAATLVIVLGTFAVRRATLLQDSASPSELLLKRDGELSLRLRDGSEIDCVPAERRYVNRWLVVLELARVPVTHRTILVAGDMLAPSEFRQLRLWALWRALPPARPAASA